MACNNQLIGGNNNPFSATTYGAVSGAVPMNTGFNAPLDKSCPSSQYKFVCQCDQTFVVTNNPNFDCANPNSSFNPNLDCQSDGIYDLQKGSSDGNVNSCCGCVGGTSCPDCTSSYYQGGYSGGAYIPPYNECSPSCPSNFITTQVSPIGKTNNPLMPTILKGTGGGESQDAVTTANDLGTEIVSENTKKPLFVPFKDKKINPLVLIGGVLLLLVIFRQK